MNKIKEEISSILEELITVRRYIHQNAEVGFELFNTVQFVKGKLMLYGYTPYDYGKMGIVCELNNNCEKTILFRADMDALPIDDLTELEFKSSNNMHACGHDIHTAILLGAAIILRKHINELKYNIKFMFQPAEELLEGAKDMIDCGILDNVSYAFMLHVLVPCEHKTGTLILSDDTVCAPSCDYFDINIIGKSVHSAMPQLGIDPIIIASNIVNSLNHTNSNDVNFMNDYTLTFGSINGGNTYNVIPDEVKLKGTLRTYNENLRIVTKNRIYNLSNQIVESYNAKVELFYPTSVPVLINNKLLVTEIYDLLRKDLNVLKTSELLNKSKSSGSEDFAYISQKVPSLMISLCAGNKEDGYIYPLHNNKVIFDEDSILYGVLTFVFIALKKAL